MDLKSIVNMHATDVDGDVRANGPKTRQAPYEKTLNLKFDMET